MLYVIRYPPLGYLVTERDPSRADGNRTYSEKKADAKRFKTQELALEAMGEALAPACTVSRVKK